MKNCFLSKTVSFAVFSLVFSSSAMATITENFTGTGNVVNQSKDSTGVLLVHGNNNTFNENGGSYINNHSNPHDISIDNTLMGSDNVLTNVYSSNIVGDVNNIKNSDVVVVGQVNNISGVYGNVIGDVNTVNVEMNKNSSHDTNTTNVYGNKNQVTKTGANITGNKNNVSGKNASVLGSNTTVTSSNSVTLGDNSTNDRDNTVSVGSSGSERQITNVQAGTQDTDAVNVGQLNSVKNNVADLTNQVNQNTTNIANNTSQINQNVTNIANNTSQINQNTTNIENNTSHINKNTVDIADLKVQQNAFEHSTNKRFESVYERMGELRKEYQGGIASAVAMSHIPQAFDYGSATIGVGMGNFRDGVAIAVGGSRISDNGNWTTKFSVSVNTNNDSSLGLGVGYAW